MQDNKLIYSIKENTEYIKNNIKLIESIYKENEIVEKLVTEQINSIIEQYFEDIRGEENPLEYFGRYRDYDLTIVKYLMNPFMNLIALSIPYFKEKYPGRSRVLYFPDIYEEIIDRNSIKMREEYTLYSEIFDSEKFFKEFIEKKDLFFLGDYSNISNMSKDLCCEFDDNEMGKVLSEQQEAMRMLIFLLYGIYEVLEGKRHLSNKEIEEFVSFENKIREIITANHHPQEEITIKNIDNGVSKINENKVTTGDHSVEDFLKEIIGTLENNKSDKEAVWVKHAVVEILKSYKNNEFKDWYEEGKFGKVIHLGKELFKEDGFYCEEFLVIGKTSIDEKIYPFVTIWKYVFNDKKCSKDVKTLKLEITFADRILISASSHSKSDFKDKGDFWLHYYNYLGMLILSFDSNNAVFHNNMISLNPKITSCKYVFIDKNKNLMDSFGRLEDESFGTITDIFKFYDPVVLRCQMSSNPDNRIDVEDFKEILIPELFMKKIKNIEESPILIANNFSFIDFGSSLTEDYITTARFKNQFIKNFYEYLTKDGQLYFTFDRFYDETRMPAIKISNPIIDENEWDLITGFEPESISNSLSLSWD